MFLWTPPLSFRHLILLVSAITITATSAQDAAAATATVTGFDVELLKTRLPKALSDFTVVSDSSTGKVYLQGGCDAVNGNVFNDTYKEFVCESLSLTSYVFDLNAQEFTETNPMPVARFRHAAVLVNNQIWLVGGRDPNDDVVTTVDASRVTQAKTIRYDTIRYT